MSNYYDLVVKPGTTQNLSLSVTNRTAEVRHVRLSVTDAWSQSNGQVSYSPGAPADDSAEHRLTDLGPAPMTLTLAPKEVKTVTVPLKIPRMGSGGSCWVRYISWIMSGRAAKKVAGWPSRIGLPRSSACSCKPRPARSMASSRT